MRRSCLFTAGLSIAGRAALVSLMALALPLAAGPSAALAQAAAPPASSGKAAPGATASDGLGGSMPLDINADNAIEWHQDRHAYVARGNASARKENTTVYGDVLTAYYRVVPGKGNEVFQLVATGNVRIISPNQHVFGDRAVYETDRKLLVVTGKALRLITPTDVVTARDALEYYEEQQLAVARGDAVAVRSTDRIAADVLIALFEKGPDGGQKMKRLDGSGNVVVTSLPKENPDGTRPAGDRPGGGRQPDVGRGDKMVYSAADNTAVLLGNVSITRGDNQITGDAAEMDMTTHINRVIAGPGGGRVSGLLIPESDDGKGGAKPGDAKPAAKGAAR